MAIFLKPGPIEHLDHAWQPQSKDWEASFRQAAFGLAAAGAMIGHGVRTNGYTITMKVDDAVSVRIGRLGGKLAVGYKGGSAPWLMSESEIEEHYEDNVGLADKLRGVLRHSAGLAIPDGCYIQAGYMGHHDNGLPDRVTPNVIEYPITPGKKLALVPISLNRINDVTSMVDWTEVGPVIGDYDNVVHIHDNILQGDENIIDDPAEVRMFIRDLSGLLGAAGRYGRRFFDRPEVLPTLNHGALPQYLNKLNREGWDCPDTGDYIDFSTNLSVKHAASLKTAEGKDRVLVAAANHEVEVGENIEAYNDMFEMIDCMHQASVLIAQTCDGEGYTVSSYPNAEDGSYTSMKIVDPDYTSLNHTKWNHR